MLWHTLIRDSKFSPSVYLLVIKPRFLVCFLYVPKGYYRNRWSIKRRMIGNPYHFIVFSSTGFGYANQRIVREVRTDTFASLLRQDIAYFDAHNSGELASRLNSDCGEMASDLVSHMLWRMPSIPRHFFRLIRPSDLVFSVFH
jgi:ABC-type multidrug transport system fused ATPase/permease subunit